jgi:hypothetical protein
MLQANEDIYIGDAISMTNPGVGFSAQAGGFLNVQAPITTKAGAVSLYAGHPGSLTGPSEGALYVGAAIDTTGGGAFPAGNNISLNAPISDVGGNAVHISAPLNAGTSGGVIIDGQQAVQTAGGAISANFLSVSVTAGVVNLAAANSIKSDVSIAGQNAVTFNNTHGGAVNLSGISSAAGSVTLTAAGPLTTDNVVSAATNLSITAGGAIGFGDDVSAGGVLNVNTSAGNGSISNSTGAFVAGGAATFNAGTGSIDLPSNFNQFTTLSLSGSGSIHARDSGGMSVTALNLNAANTAVDLQSSGLLQLPAQSINTGSASLQLLSGTSLTTNGALSGGYVGLQSNNGNVHVNHNVTSTGTLSVAANSGGFVQGVGSSINVGGMTTIAATGGSIGASQAGNSFTGPVNLSAPGNINFASGSSLQFQSLSAGGNLTLTSGGTMSMPTLSLNAGQINLGPGSLGRTSVSNPRRARWR